MRKLKKVMIVLAFLSVFLFPLVSAYSIQINPSSISESVVQGQNKAVTINYNIDNLGGNATTIPVSIGNFQTGLLSSSMPSISIPANQTISGTFTLTFSTTSSTATSNYSAWISVGTFPIFANLNVLPSSTSSGNCRIYILPIPLSKTIEGDTTTSQSVDVYVSRYCSSALTITTNQPVMQKPIRFDSVNGLVEPSGKFSILITYDSRSVQRGTYTDNIVISGIDEDEHQYTLTIPISATVTSYISPITNGSIISNLPSCSLSATDFKMNETYKFICQNVNPNIIIRPKIDTAFLRGISVEEASNSYTYSMQPIKIGETEFNAEFIYKEASVGTPFSQKIKIMKGNIYIENTEMKFKFYPELYDSKDGLITVNVVDNSSGNILPDAKVYLDGIRITGTKLTLEQGKNYELRSVNDGYSDLIQIISLNPKPINFTISSKYVMGDSLDFITSPANATILYDDQIITFPFILSQLGSHKITASLMGYSTTERTIEVIDNANILESTSLEDAKIGKMLQATISREASLRIDYKKDSNSNSKILNQTYGNKISIKLSDAGTYGIYSDQSLLKTYDVDSKPIYKNIFFWTALILVVVILSLFVISRRQEAPSQQPLSMNVGGY